MGMDQRACEELQRKMLHHSDRAAPRVAAKQTAVRGQPVKLGGQPAHSLLLEIRAPRDNPRPQASRRWR